MLFAELSGVAGSQTRLDPEDVRRIVGNALALAVAEVEGLGGTVTSVSGAGLAAVFGAPEAHEDDPERAVRAGFRMLSAASIGAGPHRTERLSVRVGVETGPAVVGPLWSGATGGYGAVGEVVEAAAALQSAAKSGSVLVGPATKEATEGIFDWAHPSTSSPAPRPSPWTRSTWSGQRRFALVPRAGAITGETTSRSVGTRSCWRSTKRCEEPHQGRALSFSWWGSPRRCA